MAKRQVYIVSAHAGEYEDSRDWNVAIFSTKLKAEKFRDRCVLDATRVKEEQSRYYNEDDAPKPTLSTVDPSLSDYEARSVRYFVETYEVL